MYAFTGVLVLLLPFCDAFQQPIQLLSGATSRLLPSNGISRVRFNSQLCLLRALGDSQLLHFPAVPVPPSQVDRAIVPGQRRELHLYAPADVAAVRKACDGDGQFLHVVMDPEALAKKEFALCTYGTVLRVMNIKASVHRTMMGTNMESLLVDV